MERGEVDVRLQWWVLGGVPSALLGSGYQGTDECDLSQVFSPEIHNGWFHHSL